MDRAVPRRGRVPDPMGRFIYLSGGPEHASGGTRGRPWRDPDDAAPQFREEVEAIFGLPPDAHSFAILPIGYPSGRFGPVGRKPLDEVAYQDRWGRAYSGR
jgi:hypothetical protein